MEFLSEWISFLRHRKKMWLLPLLLLMVTMGALLFAAKGSAVAPFIYTLF